MVHSEWMTRVLNESSRLSVYYASEFFHSSDTASTVLRSFSSSRIGRQGYCAWVTTAYVLRTCRLVWNIRYSIQSGVIWWKMRMMMARAIETKICAWCGDVVWSVDCSLFVLGSWWISWGYGVWHQYTSFARIPDSEVNFFLNRSRIVPKLFWFQSLCSSLDYTRLAMTDSAFSILTRGDDWFRL